ncbi:MAG: carboxypeptidase-like regulatory domain-containing protein [Bacteroidales bacterium]
MSRISIILLILLVISCSEETRQYDFKGDLSIKIFTTNDLDFTIDDNDSVKILVEGIIPEQIFFTDTGGYCILDDLPMGTYNLTFTKEGYYPFYLTNFKYYGLDDLTNLTIHLRKKCSILIEDFDIQFGNNKIYVTGTYSTDNNTLPDNYYNIRNFRLLAGKSENISYDHHDWSINFSTENENLINDSLSMIYFKNLFPTNSIVNIAIIGRSNSMVQIYHPEQDISEVQGYGTMSEVKSFIVP